MGMNDVDRYLAALPADQRAVLEKLRQTIKSAAPTATEKISYRMPMFFHHGMLVGYAAFKEHCSLFFGTYIVKEFEQELARYDTSKGTIRFTVDQPLPATLVKKLVKARMAENEAKRTRKAK
jgi:uncharacterized protein YdhG (YjbR/CyaY superfamily)